MSELELQPGEEIILLFRKHWVMFALPALSIFVTGLIPFALAAYTSVMGVTPEFMYKMHIPVLASLWWLIVLWCSLAVLWTNYYLDLWVVTNRRIINIDQIRLFNRNVSTWGIERVQEVTVHTENFWQTFFHYGTLQIQTAGPTDEYARASGVPHPERVREVIIAATSRVGVLEEANKNQEKLLHTVSHEVKSYLSKDAAALASIAEGDFGPVGDPVKKIAENALSETRRGVSAVMDMLSETSAKTGSLQLSRNVFDLSPVVTELVDQFRPIAEKKGLALSSTYSGPCNVRGDEIKLRDLVFRNFIDNSIRYTPSGSITIHLYENDGNIFFSIADTGVGLEETDKTRLFTDGGHGTHSRDINPESTGFGLSSAKAIVDAHGGRIWVDSEGKNKGTTFVIGLPGANKNV